MAPPLCADCAKRVIDLNNAIQAWAPTKSTSLSPITIIDQWTGFNDASDTIDMVHPNDSGNRKIAARWYPKLAAVARSFTISRNEERLEL